MAFVSRISIFQRGKKYEKTQSIKDNKELQPLALTYKFTCPSRRIEESVARYIIHPLGQSFFSET